MNELTISNISGNFSKLTNREREILEGICDGLLYKEIADKLTIAEGTVKRTVSNIYTKLGLSEIKSRNARMKIINIHFCPMLHSNESTPSPEPLDNEILIIPPYVENIIEEDEGMFYVLIPPEVVTKFSPENSPKGFQWKRDIPSGILAILVLLGLNSIFSLVNLGNFQTQGLNVEPQIEFVEVTVEVPKEVTVEVPQIIVATDDPNQPTQTARVEQKVVTATPPPPTLTNSPSLVSEPGFVFSDDFELGPDPAWDSVYGELGMANGKYTVIAPSTKDQTTHFSLLTNYFWDNLSLEMEISEFRRRASNNGFGVLIINYTSQKGGVGLVIYPQTDGIQFATLSRNGDFSMIDSTHVEEGINFYNGSNKIRIDVVGDNYFAYFNNVLLTSATIKGYDSGQVGVWMITNDKYDDPDIYAPRIEYITIESLP